MKRCTQCNRVEADDALVFCRADGTALVSDSGSISGDAGTAKFGSGAGSSEIETSILPHTSTAPEINRPTGPTTVLPATQVGSTSALRKPARRKPVIAVVLLITAVVSLAIVVGGYLYYSRKSSTAIESIAVLPFENQNHDLNSEYLSDGITESIINSLSQLPKLKVMARTTVFRYKGKATDAQKVGKELGVEAVLTGKLLQRGDTLVIQAELVKVYDGSELWGEQYTRKLSDVLAVQGEIAKEISEKLRPKLSGEEQKLLARHSTENTEAYQEYLKGYHYFLKFTDEDIKKSLDHFQQAIDKDPNYAPAYVGLADAYAVGTLNMNPAEVAPKATAAAQKAMSIDPMLADAHYAVALVSLRYGKDWPTAEKEFQEAIRLKPSYALAYDWYGYLLAMEGRFDEAMTQYRRGLETDPLSSPITADIGTCYYWSHRYDQAAEQLQKALELDPTFSPAVNYRAATYAARGQYAEALDVLDKFKAQGIFVAPSLRGYIYARWGKKDEALRILKELNEQAKTSYVLPESFAYIYVGLGEKERAIEWLQKSCQQASLYLQSIKVEPMFDNLRSDSRFPDLVRCVGVPQ